jgi:hypothetical protein
MKKIYRVLSICMLVMIAWPAFSQNVESALDEAQTAYRSGNLEAARFALQQAMNEVDLAIGREVLALFPDQLGPMPKADTEDQVASASMGFAGLYVQRAYRSSDGGASAELQVLADSPLLAGINAILSLPSFVSDANQKRIRVANYRALLQRNEDSTGTISWDIQVPFGSSLMTLQVSGMEDENAVVTMANTIPVDQVARLIQ